jgi:hypothetical protein
VSECAESGTCVNPMSNWWSLTLMARTMGIGSVTPVGWAHSGAGMINCLESAIAGTAIKVTVGRVDWVPERVATVARISSWDPVNPAEPVAAAADRSLS